MAGIFYAAPKVPPYVPPAIDWSNSEHWWTDYLGNVWDLATGSNGVCLQAGARGMSMPPIIRYTSKSPAVAGSRWRGSNVDEREVFWPLQVYSDAGSQAWLDLDRAFWQGMDPDHVGTWTYVQPNGEARSLRCRFVDDGQQAFDIAPELYGWTTYGITMIAESPYWVGDTITDSWGLVDEGTNFFGTNGGPPFTIAPASSLSTAKLSNPGDVAGWPVWTVYGPTTSATIGLAGKTITIPITLADGDWLRIDTAPAERVARMGSGPVTPTGGVDRTADLGATSFARIPADKDVKLSLTIVGTGRVRVELAPNYYRAW